MSDQEKAVNCLIESSQFGAMKTNLTSLDKIRAIDFSAPWVISKLEDQNESRLAMVSLPQKVPLQ
jgi:hypothetical protein